MKLAKIAIAAGALMLCQSVLAAGMTSEKPMADVLALLPQLTNHLPKVSSDEIAEAVLAGAANSQRLSPACGAGFQQSTDNLAIATVLYSRK